ncbi:MAG: 1,4-dihydroxy-2-naphthoate octaprenyltransferase [Ignavibacteriae bacterium]|nr:MAG: 1,4-dihydroxy-2-naphthoate octaprenyltransferase [Ignavibacteriota bacterium]
MANETQKSKLQIWIQGTRPFSFTASMIPCVVGAMLALLFSTGPALWYLLPFIMLSSLLLHAATNLIGDYYDFIKGVDTKDSFGGSRVITDGLLEPKQVFKGGIILFAAAFLLGLPIIFARGEIILYLGIAGILGGFFYSGWPIGYKYYALGNIFVFALMGPFMVVGTYYALTGTYNPSVLYTSLPIGCLVAGILQANNLRDIKHDRDAKIKTLAGVMGSAYAKAEYLTLIIGAYIIVVGLVVFNVLSPWALLVFLSLPPAIKNMTAIRGVQVDNSAKIAMLDVQTAQLHLMFGLLLSISILISKFV